MGRLFIYTSLNIEAIILTRYCFELLMTVSRLNVPNSGAAPSFCGHNVCSFVRKFHDVKAVNDDDAVDARSSTRSPRSMNNWQRTKSASSLWKIETFLFEKNMETFVEAHLPTCVSKNTQLRIYSWWQYCTLHPLRDDSLQHATTCTSDLPQLLANLIEATTKGIGRSTREANKVIVFATIADRTYKNSQRFS